MNFIDNFFKAIEAYQSLNEQEKDVLTKELAIKEFDEGDFFVKEREHSNELALFYEVICVNFILQKMAKKSRPNSIEPSVLFDAISNLQTAT